MCYFRYGMKMYPIFACNLTIKLSEILVILVQTIAIDVEVELSSNVINSK